MINVTNLADSLTTRTIVARSNEFELMQVINVFVNSKASIYFRVTQDDVTVFETPHLHKAVEYIEKNQ